VAMWRGSDMAKLSSLVNHAQPVPNVINLQRFEKHNQNFITYQTLATTCF
jgi:hypothetical protein